jgi:hypothetical protein
VLTPFADAFDRFADAWRGQVIGGWDDEEVAREFVTDLYASFAPEGVSSSV